MRTSFGKQTTLGESVRFSGAGVHSGKPATIVLHPAEADRGVVFVRTDGEEVEIAARYDNVVATELCTMIGIGGRTVATIEHLMAALAGSGVDNVVVEIDGPEMPIADGCSAAFIEMIAEAGLRRLAAPRKVLRVVKPVRLEVGDALLEFLPHDGTRYDVTIDFSNPLIGRQSYVLDLSPKTFARDIARARTFGFMADVEKLWKMGFALGSSLDNSVAIGNGRILNPEGLRWSDEFVRHKTLDAVGDLSLIGMPFLGHFRSYKGGHKLNWMAVKALVAATDAFEIVHDTVATREPAGGILQAAALAPSRD